MIIPFLPSLPYGRPRLIEIHDQEWCPAAIRQFTQQGLTFLWTHRIPPFQARAPYEIAAEVLEEVVDEVEEEAERAGHVGSLSLIHI